MKNYIGYIDEEIRNIRVASIKHKEIDGSWKLLKQTGFQN